MNTNNRKTFTLNHKIEDGTIMAGTFTTKRLSIRDRGQIGVKKSQLSGGMYCVKDDDGKPTGQGIDENTDYLNAMVAHLAVCLIQEPDWWNLDEISSIGLVQAVYEEVMDFEMSFFRSADGGKDQGRSGQVGENGSGDANTQAGTGGPPTQVVGQEVQASLDA